MPQHGVLDSSETFLERLREKLGHLLLVERFRQRYVGAIGGNFVVLDALHASDDDEIESDLFVMVLDFVLGLFDEPAHRLTDFAARTYARVFSVAGSMRSICPWVLIASALVAAVVLLLTTGDG